MYLTVARPPVLRVNLQLRMLETAELDLEDLTRLMKSITPDRNQKELEDQGATHFAFAFGDVSRFRVSIRVQVHGLQITLRCIKPRPQSLQDTGLPTIMKALCRRRNGLVLVCGSSCSGKTALIASMIDFINREMSRRITILEDPVEFWHKHEKSLITIYDLGMLPTEYPDAIRRTVREGTGVIMVGRFEDADTIEAALDAAATGSLVIAHMNSPKGVASALDHLVDRFPTQRQEAIWRRLADALICAIYQVLCPGKNDPVPASEFIVANTTISDLIREKQTEKIDEAIRAGHKYGMRVLDDDLYRLFECGEIAADALLEWARHPGEIQGRIEKNKRGDEPDNDLLSNRVPAPPRGPTPGLEGHADPNGN